MKKKDENLNKVSMFYDREYLPIAGIFVAVIIITLAVYFIGGNDLRTETDSKTAAGILTMLTIAPFFCCWLLLCLRRRNLDETGISAKFFGMTCKHIDWADMKSVKWEIIYRKMKDRRRMVDRRYMLVFTSKPKSNGKPTVIMMEETDEACAIVEKYFGPVESDVPTVNVKYEKER